MVNVRTNPLHGYEAWVNSIDWTWWCTFTTPYELTLNSTRRLMERFHQRVSNYTGKCTMFWVAEPFECKDGYHAHGLIDVPSVYTEPTHYQNIIDTYQICTGAKVISNDNGKLKFADRSRVDMTKYSGKKNAGRYCLKYISKSQDGHNKGDYDFLV